MRDALFSQSNHVFRWPRILNHSRNSRSSERFVLEKLGMIHAKRRHTSRPFARIAPRGGTAAAILKIGKSLRSALQVPQEVPSEISYLMRQFYGMQLPEPASRK
jgi:hypothetical protein